MAKAKPISLSLFEIGALLLWFYGGITENVEDYSYISELKNYEFPPNATASGSLTSNDDFNTDLDWYLFFAIMYTITMFFVGLLLICFTCCKLAIIVTEKGESFDGVLTLCTEYLQLVLLFWAFWKLLIFGSMLNKFRYNGLWNGDDDTSLNNLQHAVISAFSIFFDRKSSDVALGLKNNIRKTAFNIFRTLVFYFPIIGINSDKTLRKLIAQCAEDVERRLSDVVLQAKSDVR